MAGAERVTLKVSDGGEMSAYVARPQGEGTHPGILVLPEAFGVDSHIRDVADRFARQGYLAVAPELFHRTAPAGFEGSYGDFAAVMPHVRAVTAATAEADLQSAFAWLRAQPGIRADEIFSTGFCMGGRISFLANTVLPLRAAASFYGAGIAPDLVGRAGSSHGSMLLIWGLRDRHIREEQRKAVADALAQKDKTFAVLEFSAADHGFFCDQRASYHRPSAQAAWAFLLEFFRAYGGERR